MKGNVFDIQRYSIHDGEGIRTVVFLKGCPLRCRWCSNPESQHASSEVFYIRSRCLGCRSCVHSCPNGEIGESKDGIIVHHDRCRGDLSWTGVCPAGALRVKGEWMEEEEVFDEIMKDRVFYDHSGGGVTFSGGEPLLQADFTAGVLKRCKDERISTAVETTGEVPWESIEKVIPVTDLFLYDIKSMDDDVHRKWTGGGNARILENLKRLSAAVSKAETQIMVRTPLIPGVNDADQSVEEIMDFLSAAGISRYSILPFHQYGSGKYESIGMNYELADLVPPTDEQVERIRRRIRERGFSGRYS